jgi:hypothetical protein
MATFTVSIPENLKARLDSFPHINWSEYIKSRFELRAKEFQKLRK